MVQLQLHGFERHLGDVILSSLHFTSGRVWERNEAVSVSLKMIITFFRGICEGGLFGLVQCEWNIKYAPKMKDYALLLCPIHWKAEQYTVSEIFKIPISLCKKDWKKNQQMYMVKHLNLKDQH